MRGQPLTQPGADLGRLDTPAGPWVHVGDQHGLAGVWMRVPDGDGEVDVGMLAEGGVDLAQFDAEAADLHLVVGSAEELQFQALVSGPLPPDDIAGAVHPRTGFAERVGHKPLSCQVEPAEVSARDGGPGHVELTGDTRRHGLQT